MPLRSDWSAASCPIARSADVLADPWVLLVLRELFSGHVRFDELARATGAAESVLARRLRTLTEHGLVGRRKDGGYGLTSSGRETLPILHAYAMYSTRVEPDADWGMRLAYARCGTALSSPDRCTACDLPVDVESTSWSRRSMGGWFDLADTAGLA